VRRGEERRAALEMAENRFFCCRFSAPALLAHCAILQLPWFIFYH